MKWDFSLEAVPTSWDFYDRLSSMIESSQFLVLRSIPYQDNHLILTVLNQNGYVYTLQCLGGQGSLKRKTGQKLDLGQIFHANSMVENHKFQHLYLKEFELQWFPKSLRNSYGAWSLLHFILEICSLIFDKRDFSKTEWEQLKNERNFFSHQFQVTVKFLYLLDDWSEGESKLSHDEIYCIGLLFLSKVALLEGVMPNLSFCSQCVQPLSMQNVAQFHSPSFYCQKCQSQNAASQFLWNFLSWSKAIKYEEINRSHFVENDFMQIHKIKYCFDELFLLLNLSKDILKTYSLVLNDK